MNPGGAVLFLIQTLFDLFVTAILLRLLLQWVRADFYNPLCQFLVNITNPVIIPLRRIIPSIGRLDTASVVAMVALQAIELFGALGVVPALLLENCLGPFHCAALDQQQADLPVGLQELAAVIDLQVVGDGLGAVAPVLGDAPEVEVRLVLALTQEPDADESRETLFSERLACNDCGTSMPEMSPASKFTPPP